MHAITDDRVCRLSSLLSEGKSPRDKRGKNVPGNAKPGVVIDAVKSHIASFHVKTSHYSAREYHYLDAKLNLKIMDSLFTHDFPELTVSYDYYLHIFKENFSLGLAVHKLILAVVVKS
ncbi:hypothetical protein PR048_003606 [Dryococelus australis]|uniref:Uncharacterized protein n=1 Tax=Dryococelus australis TaxID=614101 RepID=A0ABQ9INJ3_9NEOP|nr:hypothetical protein PR048_003606 [Dryococelus australis]